MFEKISLSECNSGHNTGYGKNGDEASKVFINESKK